jgi:hypothetical protein
LDEALRGHSDARLDEVLASLPALRSVSVFEVTLFCLIERREFRPAVSLERCSLLVAFARACGARPSAQRTS